MYWPLPALMAISLAIGAAPIAAPTPGKEVFAVVKRIPGPDGNWDYVIADSIGRRLYVARDYGVMTIDLDTGAVARQLIAGQDVHAIAALGDTGLFVSTNGASGTVTLFEGKTGRVLGSVKAGTDPDSVVYEPKSRLVIAFNHQSGDATVIDPMSRRAVATIPIGGTLEFGAVDAQGHAYVNVADKNQIAVLDVQARRVTETIPLKGCKEPSGLAYDAAEGLLISVCFNGVAEFINPKTHQELARVATGTFPDAVIWDANRRLAFVPSFADGNLTIISVRNANEIKIVQKLVTQVGTRTGALDASTGRIYLPTSKLTPAAIRGAYPTPVAGTFEVLVVASEESIGR